MSLPDRTRRRTRLVLVALLLGALVSPGAVAQTEPEAERPDASQFGGFIVSARSNGFQLTYDSPGLLPTGSPIFQLSVPEALATLNSGPVGYGLASFAYPGPLVADLGAALAAGGQETGIPPYPVRSEAFYPSGPTEETSGDQGTEMRASATHGDSRALTSYTGLDFAPAAFVGSSQSTSQSVIEGDQLVSRTRTAVSDVVLFGGIITIDAVVTDIVATSNGVESATAGGTTVSGMSVLGMPATVDRDGIRFVDEPQEDPSENPVGGPVEGAFGGALDPVQDGLHDASGPLNELYSELGITGDDALAQLLEQSGIDVRLLGPIETVDGGTAERTANGLSVTMNYDGNNTPVLTDVLALVPSSSLPADNLGPIPLSPQAMFNLLKERHITGVALAPANVSTAATPAFEFEPPDFVADVEGPGAVTSGPQSPSAPGSGSAGFETATPDLPSAPAAGGAVPASSGGAVFGHAVPVLAALALVLAAPFLAAGSRSLADNTLAAAATTCPEGRDRPPLEEDRP